MGVKKVSDKLFSVLACREGCGARIHKLIIKAQNSTDAASKGRIAATDLEKNAAIVFVNVVQLEPELSPSEAAAQNEARNAWLLRAT